MAKTRSKKTKPTCPKCGQEMDARGDGVWVCGDCGWEQPGDDQVAE